MYTNVSFAGDVPPFVQYAAPYYPPTVAVPPPLIDFSKYSEQVQGKEKIDRPVKLEKLPDLAQKGFAALEKALEEQRPLSQKEKKDMIIFLTLGIAGAVLGTCLLIASLAGLVAAFCTIPPMAALAALGLVLGGALAVLSATLLCSKSDEHESNYKKSQFIIDESTKYQSFYNDPAFGKFAEKFEKEYGNIIDLQFLEKYYKFYEAKKGEAVAGLEIQIAESKKQLDLLQADLQTKKNEAFTLKAYKFTAKAEELDKQIAELVKSISQKQEQSNELFKQRKDWGEFKQKIENWQEYKIQQHNIAFSLELQLTKANKK